MQYYSVLCADAAAIFDKVEESFTTWPVERQLTLRDVVRYVAVSDYLSAKEGILGTNENLGDTVATRIARSL